MYVHFCAIALWLWRYINIVSHHFDQFIDKISKPEGLVPSYFTCTGKGVNLF